MRTLLFITLALALLWACRKPCPEAPDIYVYKTKADYSTKVSVVLSDDKSEIIRSPSHNSMSFNHYNIANLEDGYLLNGFMPAGNRAINVVFLSVEREDFANWTSYPGSDSMMKLIIDLDPFTELYYNCGENFLLDFEKGGLDTMRINQIIRDGELDKYFTKLK